MYNDVTSTTLFPSFVLSCVPQIDRMSVLEEVYQIQSEYESDDRSNHGGYHSPTFTGTHFLQLKHIVEEFTNDFLYKSGFDIEMTSIEYWCNINKCYNYNVMHCHSRTDLIGIYYVKVPPDSGELVVMRNDGSQYISLYENRTDMLEYSTEPEEGRLYILPGHLWHYVTCNNTEEDRISISFNIDT